MVSGGDRSTDAGIDVRWIQTGVAAGLLTCLIYPAVVVGHPPAAVAVPLIAAFGPLLAMASIGLRKLLAIHRCTVSADAAACLNAIGGALFSTMLLIQVAVPLFTGEARAGREIVGIWLGIDVAWDAYIGAGTALFACSMWGHPRFGRWFAASGLAVAGLLLTLNMITFPMPPDRAGLFDVGPLVGAWYLAVSVQAARSVGWARTALGHRHTPLAA